MKTMIIVVLVLPVVLLLIAYLLGNHLKFVQKFFCKIGWHSHDYEMVSRAEGDPYGTATRYKCKWCGMEGLIDSQGNLF